MTNDHDAPERSEIEDLLPWHAAGTLSRREAEQVEAALARDPELARRFELVREEMAATIHLNENLGAPSARPMQQLFAAIDAAGPVQARSPGLRTRLTEFFAGLRPQTMAWASGAACLALVLQAGVITNFYVAERGGNFVVSERSVDLASVGSFALVRFAPNASAAAITSFLQANEAIIVRGPNVGGLYRVRVSAQVLPKDQRDRLIARLASETSVIGFIAATE
jgi:anti-sigma factor RsiW